MIIRFINVIGEVNHGIVIDRDPPTGLVLVHWDAFQEQLSRLEGKGRVAERVRRELSEHWSWLRVESPLPPPATLTLLPMSTPVSWHSDELAGLQADRCRAQGAPEMEVTA